MRLTSVCVGIVAGFFLAALAKAAPVQVISSFSSLAAVTGREVLYQNGELAVVRSDTARDEDFRDLYVVNMSRRLAAPTMGELLYFAPARLAVMRLNTQEAAALAGSLHGEGLACGVLFKLSGDKMATTQAPTPTPLIPTASPDARVAAVTSQVSAPAIAATINELAAVPTRFHDTSTGAGIADFLAAKYEALRNGRGDVTITPYDHGEATAQRSLVVRIQGTTNPDEVIVLGSHLDSVNWRDGTDERAPGADDNASGTATNLEIFRVLMASGLHLKRSVEIHAYAAEEVGLVGSQDLVKAYQAKGVQVVAMLQHDMDLYNPPGESDKIWLVSNNADAGFNHALEQLVDAYAGVPWGEDFLSGGTSDHESWHRAGYAVAFPFESPQHYNHHIHSAEDTVAASGAFSLAAAFAKLGSAYILHYGGID